MKLNTVIALSTRRKWGRNKLLEEYLDTITNMENYADGIIVIDDQAKVIYIRQFKPDLSPLDERRAIGKSIFEIYPTLKPGLNLSEILLKISPL